MSEQLKIEVSISVGSVTIREKEIVQNASFVVKMEAPMAQYVELCKSMYSHIDQIIKNDLFKTH